MGKSTYATILGREEAYQRAIKRDTSRTTNTSVDRVGKWYAERIFKLFINTDSIGGVQLDSYCN